MKGVFAKIIEHKGRQVLVQAVTDDDDHPVIQASMKLDMGMGITSIGMPDSEKGYALRDRIFEQILEGNHEVPETLAEKLIHMEGHINGDNDNLDEDDATDIAQSVATSAGGDPENVQAVVIPPDTTCH